jgi:hypothetical protein
MTESRTRIWVLLAVVAASGCATGDAPRPRPTTSLPEAQIRQPYVPRGTEFMVRLDQAIGTSESQAGQRFTARLLAPLLTVQGDVAAPKGSRIEGRIDRANAEFLPDLKISFTGIETSTGLVPIHATVWHGGKYAWANPHAIYDPEGLGYDAILYHPRFHPGGAIGGGPSESTRAEPQIRLPEGAEIDLILARPLLVASPKASDTTVP